MFKGSSPATKGKALSHVTLVCTDGKVIAHLQQAEIGKCTAQWMNVVAIFVLGKPQLLHPCYGWWLRNGVRWPLLKSSFMM